MINANKQKLQDFFQGNLQFEIPFFQRAHVWSEDNWAIFWDHLIGEVDAYENDIQSEHFIGTVITKQKENKNLSENIVELIDGQQRITTITVFLKALADTSKGDLPNLKESIESLLWFKDSYSKKHYRMIHSRIDKPNFHQIMETPENIDDQDNSSIVKAYQYFIKKLESFSDDRREMIKQVLLHKVPIISMLLDKDDDEQEIFDTINSLGVRLTIAELLKNYLFKDKELIEYYEEEWQSVFENDEEQVEFWSTVRSSGRVKRDNIELLLYCMLIIETKKEVRLEKLFSEYKLHLKETAFKEKKQFLLRLNDLATLYLEMPQNEELIEIGFNNQVKRFFHLLESLEITTIFPLVLYLYSNMSNDNEIKRCFKILESFIALRQICKFTTKNYNNLFIQIIRSLDKIKSEKAIESNDLLDILKSFNDFGNRLPSKVEVEEAFHNSVLSNKQAGVILYTIALKDIDSEYSDTKTLSSKSFSVEHMMPKKWEENWSESNLDELSKFKRNQKILTIGNLTLITKNLNSKLRNQSWANKKQTLKEYSSLKMTTSFLELEKWDEESISERADQLCHKALEIWNVE